MKYSLNPDLNDEQKQAVAYNDGPLLIVAGAGTGKTTVLVEKIKKLIMDEKASPEEILALTFTEKAAFEMEERVDKALPYGYFQMWISTFHSFADQILREEIVHIGLNGGYKLLTQAETIMFLRSNLFKFDLKYFRPLGNPTKFLEAMLQHFGRLRDEDITATEYLTWAKKQKENTELLDEEKEKILELANAYVVYQDLKVKAGYFDFDDLIYYLLELFRKRTHILEKYRKKFKYILVDEFQDTNIAQYTLIKLLCPNKNNPFLTVVGDDSQAIYKFRGASVSNILNFMTDYPGSKQITLNKNYRSYQTILDASYTLIQHNNPDTLETKLGISKKLIASRGEKKDAVEFHLTDHVEEETTFVAKTILDEMKKNNYTFGDFALLVRANSHADAFLSTFMRYGIPYRFLGPGMLFKQPEVKDLIAYLKSLYNIDDAVSLYRVLSMDIFKINPADITNLLIFSKKTNLPLIQAMEAYISFTNEAEHRVQYDIYQQYLPILSEDSKAKIQAFVVLFNHHLGRILKDTAGQILFDFLEKTNYLQRLATYTTEGDEKRAMNVSKFFNKLKSFELDHEEASVQAVVDFIEMSMELGESPSADDLEVAGSYDAVNILTVHASKGLEFPVTFLPNLSAGRFPTYEKRETLPIPQELVKETLPEGNYHLQEERRLFYVAATRARDKAYLTASLRYGEGKRERKISQFVVETLGEQEIGKHKTIQKEESSQLSIFDFKKIETPIVVKEKINLNSFSFSQLESFNSCGLQYKYQYLLKIPTQAAAAASFGDTIHKSLQKFYQDFINDTSIGLDHLIKTYHEKWIPLGYTSRGHQEKMKKEGERMLTEFFNIHHHPHKQVMSLERLFKIKVDDNMYITGKIDRIDTVGTNGEIEIIDYKTGKKPDEKELKKSLQLSIYALAAIDKNFFKKQLDQVTLTFYYLQDQSKISMKRTPAEMEKVKDDIKKTVDEIRKNEFPPKVGPWCKFCNFRMICEAWQ